MNPFPKVDEYLLEAVVSAYPVTKFDYVTTVGSLVAQRQVYRFKLRTGKYVAFTFTGRSTNSYDVDFGVVDVRTNKITGHAYVDKFEMQRFYATQLAIYDRFFTENGGNLALWI
jgi:hypothetical protein